MKSSDMRSSVALVFGKINDFLFRNRLPQRGLVFGYLVYVIIGTLLLMLPFAVKSDIGFLDILFTVVASVSTAGLMSVGMNDYTLFGQIVILLMIQLGAVGYMTLSSYILYRTNDSIDRTKRMIVNTTYPLPVGISFKRMVFSVIRFTLIFEAIGFVLLGFEFIRIGLPDPLWNALFYSISSFCTAGFSLYDNSIAIFSSHVGINAIISALSFVSAMGFIVMVDVHQSIVHRTHKIGLTTKIIILVSIAMTVLGTLHLFFFEPAMGHYQGGHRFVFSLFQSIYISTTTGFTIVPIAGFMPVSLLMLMAIMFIGASPSGTGGGVKSTTIVSVVAFAIGKLSLRNGTYLGKNRLPAYRVDNALTTFVFYIMVLFAGCYMMLYSQPFSLSVLLLEATAALSTTGISSGITPSLTAGGKVTLIFLMFIGRVGVLGFGTAMLARMSRGMQYQIKAKDDLVI